MNFTNHIMDTLLPARAFAAEGLNFLTPLPGVGGSFSEGDKLSSYLQDIFDIGLGIAIALAIIVMIYGGFQYLSTDAAWGKEEGKQKLTRSLWGLLIGLGIFIFLNTLNPNLLKLDLTLKELEPIAAKPTGTGAPPPIIQDCSNCVPIAATIPVKQEACDRALLARMAQEGGGGSLQCRVNSGVHDKLIFLNTKLDIARIPWRITEAWPPQRAHQNQCHKSGTCVDANFFPGTPSSAENVKKFIQAAKDAGLRPQYEVSSRERESELLAAGVPRANLLFESRISAEHFSVYNN